MTWQGTLARLGGQAEQQAQQLLARFETGVLDRETFVALAAALIARQQGRAVTAADIAVAATAARRTRQAVSPAVLALPDEQARLRGAVETVLDDRPTTVEDLSRSTADRLGRLARAETLTAGQTATQQAWAATGMADGWTRMTDADPCKVCVGWADGVKRPWTVRMARHTGCGCLPVPA